MQRCRERHVTLHLPVIGFNFFRVRENPPVWVATRIGESAENRVEGAEVGVVALEGEAGDGGGDGSEGGGELGGGEGEEEGVVVGDEFADAVEGEEVVAETVEVGIGEGLGEVEEFGDDGGDLEGEDADGGETAARGGFEEFWVNGVEAVGESGFDLDQ